MITETPESCPVNVTGIRKGEDVTFQSFNFTEQLPLSQMTLATLSNNFNDLTEVDFVYASTNEFDPPISRIPRG